MKKEGQGRNTDEFDDAFEEIDAFSGQVLNAPKRSPMRRKEKFRNKDFRTEKERKDRKKNRRNKLKYDSEFWEE